MNDLELIQKQMSFASLEVNRQRKTSQRMGGRISSLITSQGKTCYAEEWTTHPCTTNIYFKQKQGHIWL